MIKLVKNILNHEGHEGHEEDKKVFPLRNYESQVCHWLLIADILVRDELIDGIAQYFRVNRIRRPGNEYFSNGFREMQYSVLSI